METFDINNLPIKPDWLSEEAQQTLSKGYLLPGETPRDMWKRCAMTAERHLNYPGIGTDIMEMFWKGYMGGATPVLSNFGTNRGLPISCFSVHASDSVNSIYSHLKEVASLSKNGGGVGVYFGDVRPSGAPISGGGKSTGVVPWMRQYDLTASVVSQGNTRRGSFALYLPIDHPDLVEALRAKDHSQGDPRQFIDSNLAVTVTDEWIESMLAGDRRKQEVFSEVLKCRMISGSPYIIYIDNANNQKPETFKQRSLKISTSNLCFTGDTKVAVADGRNSVPISELCDTEFPVYSARKSKTRSGWFTEIQKAKAFKTGTREVVEVELEDGSTFRCTPDHLLATRDTRWIEAEDSVGEILEPYTQFQNQFGHLMVNTHSDGYRRQARMIWESISARLTKILSTREKVKSIRRRGLKVVSVQPVGTEDVYDLTVENNHNFYIITSDKEDIKSGVLVHNCSEIFLPTDENHTFVCVLSSLNLAKYDEWKTWKGPVTGKTVPELGIYFLDAVVSEFIHKAERIPSMGRAVRFAKKSRSLGLGTMGLHALYQSRGLPFASHAARTLNVEVHGWIDDMTLKASQDMAKEYGEPEWCEGNGVRHATRIAIAPTKTNSVICGAVSEGIEPLTANLFVASNAKGTFVRKNPYLEKHLEAIGYNTQDVWDSILDERGSVQHLDFLSPHAKDVFKTAREIDQFELVKQAADRQQHVCQGQSLNLFVDPEESASNLMKLHLSAWKAGVKSLYYLKSSSLQVKKAQSKSQQTGNTALVVTKPDCPWCVKAKELLSANGYVIQETDRSTISDSDWPYTTVPQIWLNGKHVEGGYEGLAKLLGEAEEKYGECLACQG